MAASKTSSQQSISELLKKANEKDRSNVSAGLKVAEKAIVGSNEEKTSIAEDIVKTVAEEILIDEVTKEHAATDNTVEPHTEEPIEYSEIKAEESKKKRTKKEAGVVNGFVIPSKKKKEKKNYTFYLTTENVKRIEQMAKDSGYSLSEFMDEIISSIG